MSPNPSCYPSSFWRIVTSLSALFAVLQALAGGYANAAVTFSGKVLDYQQSTIYHSPETPGFTEWVGLWQLPNGPIECNFEQLTGPVANPVLAFPLLQSTDAGQTWAPDPGAFPSCWCRGMAVLSDGTTMVRPSSGVDNVGDVERSTDGGRSWSSPINFASPAIYSSTYPSLVRPLRDGRLVLMAGTVAVGANPNRGLGNITKTMFLSSDGGLTWGDGTTLGQGIRLMSTSVGSSEESDFVELPNGNLCWISRTEHYNSQGKLLSSDRRETITEQSGNTFVPQASTTPYADSYDGFPCELLTNEGVILDLSMNGSHYSTDNGANWFTLEDGSGQTLNTYYYPKAVQAADGTIVVVSHYPNGDFTYGSQPDESIVEQTFRLTAAPEPSTLTLFSIGVFSFLAYVWRRRKAVA